MAQFVTHIQPTLVEASHHHPPHHHKETHIKEHHHPHVKDSSDAHHKDGHHKEYHAHISHGREFPILPHHHHIEQSSININQNDTDHKNKRDSGQYLDSHGVSHTFQLHFIDAQGIYRDCHGHGINKENIEEKEKHKKKEHREVCEEKSPSRTGQDNIKPSPPQFINLHKGQNDNKTTDGNTSFLRAARNGQLEKVLEHLESNININTSNANGLNALHLASKDGHVEIVAELLKRGAVIDAATKKGNTALHIASLAGQEEVVKLLVAHGASVNVQSQNGFTPLYMAAQENHDNVVKYLLANGANPSLSTEDGFTPLAVAMQQCHEKVVAVLLENDTKGKVRLPALHIAAKKDDVKAAKLLLDNEHNPDVTSKSGFTPLHIASHYGNQSIANLLVHKGADVNYSAKHNITPLHVAAKWGKANMVTVLLEQGANIESKTRDGLTPLHCAARSGHEQVVDMLLEKGAPISSKTKNGLAPLHMAAQGDHVDAARILLYHRAPVDEVTVDYLTALHVAAHCGHVRVAKLLLDRQADANARALNGFTPLHIACKKNRIKVVELLLKHGASIGATTESGLTPLHVASFMGCMNIVIYLLQHDANPDVPTVRGETPLHLAARANQTDIIRILLRNGAQVDARAREQQTPLHIASRLGNVDIVMLLLQHGAKVDNTTKDMYTALHIAAKEGQDEVATVLIDNGASLNATTKKGFTPLHLAAKYGHLKVAKLLLQREAPVDAQGKNGVTPLHVASHYDHQNVALLLLEKGASPFAIAKNGHTPLHIAAKKNQMDIANTLLEYGAKPNAESKAGFTPLHLSAQEGHGDMSELLIEHKADTNHRAKNGLEPLHLCAQEDKVPVADILVKNGGHVDAATKNGYTPLHIACHYGQINMVRFLLSHAANVKATTSLGYTPLHQAAQQGHTNIVNTLLESSAQPNAVTNNGQTPLHIAEKLGYITVIDTLKVVTEPTSPITTSTISNNEEKYRVVAPEAMHETFMSDSEEEGGDDTVLGDQTYRYLTADEMKGLGDDSLPIDVTRDERIDSNKIVGNSESVTPPRHIEDNISPEHVQQNYVEYIKKYTPDNVDIDKHPINIGFLVSFLVDARGGAMRGCRHSGVRVIVPPRCAASPTRITCRYVRPQRTPHPPPLMEGEALASRVLELGPVGAKFLGPVIIEVPHFAALRGKEREIVILRCDNGESWKEHTIEASEDILNEVLHDSFETEDLNQLEDVSSGRITRIVTQDFPQYFAVVSRIRQEVHAIGPEGGMVSSTVVPQVQAVFPQGALTKKIKVGLQAQPIDPALTAKLLGHGVAVSPVVTVEPRRRKFHKAITLSMPAPRAHSQGMINQYSGSAPTLRLLCSITGGTTRAQWEDVTGSTPLNFVNDCVSFTTTVSARFWLMDCRNVGDATKMATELYREAIHVPFMAKFVVFAKRVDPLEARLRVFCMTDDKEDKTLEHQEHFTEVAKSRDVEVLEGKPQYIEFAGNLVPITKSGEQLQFSFRAFRENRLPFSVRVKDQHAEAVSRCLFMREPKLPKGEPPQQPICILNIVLPDDIVADTISLTDNDSIKKQMFSNENFDYYRPDPRLADMSNLLGDDWVPLAAQLGLSTSEINVIKSEYPESIAKQAQSMLRMWLSQASNKTQANILESALKRIGREDIIPQCLNADYSPGHAIKEIEKQRLNNKVSIEQRKIIESEKIEPRQNINEIDNYDKYSAEEKVVDDISDEEDFTKTVTERRHLIEERLSVDRTVPASSQRVEIVQEISSIKRQSLVENKIAEVEQKVGSDIIDEKKTTPTSNESVISDTDKANSALAEEVTQAFETTKRTITKLVSTDDPKSPKVSKTPPPSPADFITKEQTMAIQEWDITKKSDEIPIITEIEQQGLSTTTERLVASNEEKVLDKPLGLQLTGLSTIDDNLETDLRTLFDQTNAFIQSESHPEPYDALVDKYTRKETIDIKKSTDNKNNINEKKKSKKGFFGSIKTFVERSFESDSDSEKSPKKVKKQKKEKKKKTKDEKEVDVSLPPKKAKLPTPPLAPSDIDSIPFVETSLADIPPSHKPPDIPVEENVIPVTDLDLDIMTPKPSSELKDKEKSPKKKMKSKTVYVEEVKKTIEPLVIEAEEFSIIVDPTRKESPKKSKETFTINIDESIDKIEKEILEKSPILPEEKILKPFVALDLESDILFMKSPIEKIGQSAPLNMSFNDVKNFTTNMIQNEANYNPWAFEIQTKPEKEQEPVNLKIVEKQDKEQLKEKEDKKKKKEEKPGFFGLFKKKESKKEDDTDHIQKIFPSSETVLKDMSDCSKFLATEVINFHDVKQIQQKIVKNEKSPIQHLSENKAVLQEKIEENLKNIASTKQFLSDEIHNYDDIKIEHAKKLVNESEVQIISKTSDDETKMSQKSSSSFFGFFKKQKKEDSQTDFATKAIVNEEIVKVVDDTNKLTEDLENGDNTVIKQKTLSDTVVKEIEDSKQFLSGELLNYDKEDSSLLPHEINEDPSRKQHLPSVKAVIDEKPVTDDNVLQSSPKTSRGFLGIFKKRQKSVDVEIVKPSTDLVESSQIISKDLQKTINETHQFLSLEIDNYHDVKCATEEASIKKETTTFVNSGVDEWRNLMSENKRDVPRKTDILSAQVVEETSKTNESIVQSSPKSSRGFLGIFKKRKKSEDVEVVKPSADQVESTQIINEDLQKTINETQQFLSLEVDNYHDVKCAVEDASSQKETTTFVSSGVDELRNLMSDVPIKTGIFSAQVIDEGSKIDDSVVQSSPKSSRGFLGIFKKHKKTEDVEVVKPSTDQVENSQTISEDLQKTINETQQFLSLEIDNYHDVKCATGVASIQRETTTFVSSGVDELGSLVTENKQDVLRKTDTLSAQVLDEASKSHESVVQSSPKSPRGFLGIFKKRKKSEDVSAAKIDISQQFEGINVEAEKPSNKQVVSEELCKNMDDSQEFLSREVANYSDVRCIAEETKFEPDRAPTSSMEASPETTHGLLSRLKRSMKKEEDSAITVSGGEDIKQEYSKTEKTELVEEHVTQSSPKLLATSTKQIREVRFSDKIQNLLNSTDEFLSIEIKNYDDIKPIWDKSAIVIIPSVAEIKRLKEDDHSESTVKETERFLIDEINNYYDSHDFKTQTLKGSAIKTELPDTPLPVEQKVGFLAKFKKTKKKPSMEEPEISENLKKQLTETKNFLTTELDKYDKEDIRDQQFVNLAQKASIEDSATKVSELKQCVEESESDTKLLKKEKPSKDKKGFFNIFGKKSKSQETSSSAHGYRTDDVNEGSQKKQKVRKSSSPFKFFDKTKKTEDGGSQIQIEDAMLITEAETKNDLQNTEIGDKSSMNLAQEILSNLDEKMEELKKSYSPEIKKKISDCRDFLFIEKDNYEDVTPVVITDIDNEDVLKEVDNIIDTATKVVEKNKSKAELNLIDLAKSDKMEEIKTDFKIPDLGKTLNELSIDVGQLEQVDATKETLMKGLEDPVKVTADGLQSTLDRAENIKTDFDKPKEKMGAITEIIETDITRKLSEFENNLQQGKDKLVDGTEHIIHASTDASLNIFDKTAADIIDTSKEIEKKLTIDTSHSIRTGITSMDSALSEKQEELASIPKQLELDMMEKMHDLQTSRGVQHEKIIADTAHSVDISKEPIENILDRETDITKEMDHIQVNTEKQNEKLKGDAKCAVHESTESVEELFIKEPKATRSLLENVRERNNVILESIDKQEGKLIDDVKRVASDRAKEVEIGFTKGTEKINNLTKDLKTTTSNLQKSPKSKGKIFKDDTKQIVREKTEILETNLASEVEKIVSIPKVVKEGITKQICERQGAAQTKVEILKDEVEQTGSENYQKLQSFIGTGAEEKCSISQSVEAGINMEKKICEKEQEGKIRNDVKEMISESTKGEKSKITKSSEKLETGILKEISNLKEAHLEKVATQSEDAAETLLTIRPEHITKIPKTIATEIDDIQKTSKIQGKKFIGDTKQSIYSSTEEMSLPIPKEEDIDVLAQQYIENSDKSLLQDFHQEESSMPPRTDDRVQLTKDINTFINVSREPNDGERSIFLDTIETVKSYVTSPTMARRAESQRFPRGERPTVREIKYVHPDEDNNEVCYSVTEPEEIEEKIRKPLFHLESEEDDSFDAYKIKERRDSAKSNILETLTENKIDNLLSDLEQQLVKDLEESVTVSKEPETKLSEANNKLETLKKESQADVEQIEQKLRDLDKALDSLEQASDPKLEKKLHRVERKFERMASEVMEKDAVEVSPNEAEARRETEFQKLVSQLSTEEVSDFQKEYSHLWDETTFSKSDEWDSKTPDSQVDVQELPQGEEKEFAASGSIQDPNIKVESEELTAQTHPQRPGIADQHQLSEEMKQLLQELEKESKQ